MTVLIVEDEEARAKELQSYLQSKMTRVIRAHDGFEALIFLKKHRPDLILSDVNMPGMDGYRLIKRLKENEDTKSIPIFVYSSKPLSESSIGNAMELGADRCLANTQSDGIGSEALITYAAL